MLSAIVPNPIVFYGNVAGSAMILFQKSNLCNSAVSHIQFHGPKDGIQLSTNSYDNNFDTLITDHLTVTNTQITTNGHTSTAMLVINNSSITNSTIYGAYPASEKIQVSNSFIMNSKIWSDAYNNGIILVNDSCINATFEIATYDAGIDIKDCRVYNSTVNGLGAEFTSYLSARNSEFSNVLVNMPQAVVDIYSSEFKYDGSYSGTSCIRLGYGTIDSTVFTGKGSLIAIERGPAFEERLLKFTITRSSFEHFSTDIKINMGSDGGIDSIQMRCCNFPDRPTNYIIYNNAPQDIWAMDNWWGTTSTATIDSIIFDYWDNIEAGQVHYTPFLNGPCDVTTGLLSKKRLTNDISIFPNPFSSGTVVQFSSQVSNANLLIYNCFGQLVKQISNLYGQSVVFHRYELPCGLYFLRLIQDGHLVAENKMIIM